MPETRNQLLTRFPDNTAQLIGPDDLRAMVNAIEDVLDQHSSSLSSMNTALATTQAGLNHRGTVANAAALPGSAADGDTFITENDGVIHVYHQTHGWIALASATESRLAAVETKATTNEGTITTNHGAIQLIQQKMAGGHIGNPLPATPVLMGVLRAMEIDVAYPLPKAAIPSIPGVPHVAGSGETSRTDIVGLTPGETGFQIRDAYIVRWSPDTWVLLGRKITGTPVEEPVWYMLVADATTADSVAVGVGVEAFHSATADLATEIGPLEALGSGISVVHHIAALETRIQTLEEKEQHHVPVPAVEGHFDCQVLSGILMCDADAALVYDGSEHIVDFVWHGGTKPDLSTVTVGVYVRDHTQAHTTRLMTPSGDSAGKDTVDLFVSNHSRVTVQWVHDKLHIIKVAQVATTT